MPSAGAAATGASAPSPAAAATLSSTARARPLVEDRHLLSLRDLNLSGHLGDLLDAGVTSFKIEGRLKDRAYVTNVVSWYRQRLDEALAARGWRRSSSGHSRVDFEPDVSKTFNRGFTTYFLHGRGEPPGALDSPKMVGEYLGIVTAVEAGSFLLDTAVSLHSGDGLCWFDAEGAVSGTFVNAAQPAGRGQVRVTPQEMAGIGAGLAIYRNRDHAFLRQVERSRPVRKIGVRLRLESTPAGFALHAEDEDGNAASAALHAEKEPARQPDQAEATALRQLAKTGDTPFACTGVELAWDRPYFLPVSTLNALRRETLDRLAAARAANRPRLRGQGSAQRRCPTRPRPWITGAMR